MAQNNEKQNKQHQYFSLEELKEKESILDNENTLKKEKKAHLTFTAFLSGIEPKLQSLDYWLYDNDSLNEYLAKFWLGARQSDGQKYKLNSLSSMMYSLNCILKRHGFPGIHKSDDFIASRCAFEAAKCELVKEGKGATQSAPEIQHRE